MLQSTTLHRFGLLRRAHFDFQERIVAEETTQNTFVNPAVHEQVIVQEFLQAPQVVGSFSSLGRVCCTHVQPSPSRTNRRDSTVTCSETKFQSSRWWSGYMNNLLNSSMWWLMLRPVNSVFLSLKPSLMASTSIMSGLMNPLFFSVVEDSAPQVFGSLPPFQEFQQNIPWGTMITNRRFFISTPNSGPKTTRILQKTPNFRKWP